MKRFGWISWVGLCGVTWFGFVAPCLAQPAAADLAGPWTGTLTVGAQQLRLELELEQSKDGAWSATVISVDQGGARIPASAVTIEPPSVDVELAAIGAAFEGTLREGEIAGTWKQGGSALPLTWKHGVVAAPPLRPQDPDDSLPYREEEVAIEGPAGILAGTLTLPGLSTGDAEFPWVVLISGSGLQDRDESIFGHRPFRVLADALTRGGLAVFRYDDRGFGASTGDATLATTEDFAEDTRAVVKALQQRSDLAADQFALLGHSEGALIAIRLAPSTKAHAVVSIAGPSLSGTDILTSQSVDLSRAMGLSPEAVEQRRSLQRSLVEVAASDLDIEVARPRLLQLLADATGMEVAQVEEGLAAQVDSLLQPWMRYFLRLDPAPWWRSLEIPVLALFGDRDLQVSAAENAPLLETILVGKDQHVETLEGLNHLMQPARTGLPAEYAEIEVTMAPEVLERITGFLLTALVRD